MSFRNAGNKLKYKPDAREGSISVPRWRVFKLRHFTNRIRERGEPARKFCVTFVFETILQLFVKVQAEYRVTEVNAAFSRGFPSLTPNGSRRRTQATEDRNDFISNSLGQVIALIVGRCAKSPIVVKRWLVCYINFYPSL